MLNWLHSNSNHNKRILMFIKARDMWILKVKHGVTKAVPYKH